MYLFYSAALCLAILLAAPYFLYQAFVHKKYLGSLKARLWLATLELAPAERRLVIHCVSVGEFLAAEPLIEDLHRRLPELKLVITTTTATGQQLAHERASRFADICYFPLDFAFAVERMLDQLNPVAIVILETEIWPNLLRAAAIHHIPTIIANGRISDRSFRNYKLVRPLLKPVLANVTRFLMQSEQDAARIRALGATDEQVSVCGNIKYDLGTAEQSERFERISAELNRLFHLSDQPLLVAGSTTPGEEEILLAAYRQLLTDPALANTRLLLAPRRPERFDEVAALLANAGLSYIRRSKRTSDNGFIDSLPKFINKTTKVTDNKVVDQNQVIENQVTEKQIIEKQVIDHRRVVEQRHPAEMSNRELVDGIGDVILLDSIGELAAVYRFADLVFVGGSLVPRGGHNILEPALYGRAIITGPYMNNFHKIMADFRQAQAVVQLAESENNQLIEPLAREFIGLLKDRVRRDELGSRARAVIDANRGALQQQCALIAELVTRRS